MIELPAELVPVAAGARKAGRWIWANKWRRMMVRAFAVWHLAGAICILLVTPAWADSPDSGGWVSNIFGWMHLHDSHGIDASKFYLSIDHGSLTSDGITGGGWKGICALVITGEYEIYRSIAMIAIWFIGWALWFAWLNPLVEPVRHVASAVTSMTGQLNLTPLMLTLAGFAVVIWLFRGRYSTAVYEVLVSLLIAAAAVGILSNPVEKIAGHDGLITKSRDTGLQIGAGLGNDGNTHADPHKNLEDVQAKLVDAFIRQPTQLVNFGRVLDGPHNRGGVCVAEFDNAYLHPKGKSAAEKVKDSIAGVIKDNGGVAGKIAGGVADKVLPGGAKAEDGPRNAIRDCKDPAAADMKKYADNPGFEQIIALMLLLPAAMLIFIFAGFLAVKVVVAVIGALINAIKLIPGVILGIAPALRGQLLHTITDTAMSMAQLVFAIIYAVGYATVVASLFAGGGNLIATALFVDIALIAGIIYYLRGSKGLHRWSEKLADAMSRRPGGAAPVAIHRRTHNTAQDLMAGSMLARNAIRGTKAASGTIAKKLSGKAAAGAAGVATTGGGAAVAAGVAAGVAKTVSAGKSAVGVGNQPSPDHQGVGTETANTAAHDATISDPRRTDEQQWIHDAQRSADDLRNKLSPAGKTGIAKDSTTAADPTRTGRRAPSSATLQPASPTQSGMPINHQGHTYKQFNSGDGSALYLPVSATASSANPATSRGVAPTTSPRPQPVPDHSTLSASAVQERVAARARDEATTAAAAARVGANRAAPRPGDSPKPTTIRNH